MLVLLTNRKSHTGFTLVPNMTPFNDLERRYCALLRWMWQFLKPYTSEWLKITYTACTKHLVFWSGL